MHIWRPIFTLRLRVYQFFVPTVCPLNLFVDLQYVSNYACHTGANILKTIHTYPEECRI